MPKVFISYSHDSPEHKDRILALSDRLRREGVDCIIDQYEQSPEEGWPLWCERQVEQADFVIVACTKTYCRRFRAEELPGKGLGGTWEGQIVTQELYSLQGKNSKFIPVIFGRNEAEFVPIPLQSATVYHLDGRYEDLYRRLTEQPLISKAPLGSILPMAAREPLPSQPVLERKQDFEQLWQVRHRRNIFFTGREKVLTDLRAALERGPAVLNGMGGVGKTQTGVEYAYRYGEIYRAVFWADAEFRETLLADFVSIAALLKLPSAEAKNRDLVVADVKRWLDVNDQWLLVVDNADDISFVGSFLPSRGKGHLLVTSRDRAAATLGACIDVRVMAPQEGASLLLRRAGLTVGEADQQLALQLSEELGGLPLALDQAGAFIQETRRSLAEYADLYASEKANLLTQRGTLEDHAPVTVTFSLAFEKVGTRSAAAADLLRVCAFLAPDSIPEEIFTAGAGVLGEDLGAAAKSKLGFAQVTSEAIRFSLLDRDASSQTLGIHRLVQVVIQSGMQGADQRSWAECAVRATEKAFPAVEFANWALCQRLLPHAQVCATLIEELQFRFVNAAKLLNQTGVYLFERGRYSEVEQLLQQSLAIWENTLGSEHQGVAMSLNNLARLYGSRGDYTKAEMLYRRSLGILENALGKDHRDVAGILHNLAKLYGSQKRYADAEPLYRRSLAIRRKALGPDHPDVAMSLNSLAALPKGLKEGNDVDVEAERVFRLSIENCEAALGKNHPDLATTLSTLAALYYKQGRYVEAGPLFKRALAIRHDSLGGDHRDLAISLNDLAATYYGQGRRAEAETLLKWSLAICEKALGLDHSETKKVRHNLDVVRTNRPKPETAP